MPIEAQIIDRRCIASASGDLTIYVAAEVKKHLSELLATADTVELRLAEVQEFDSAGVQLLLWLRREATVAGKTVRFCAPSAAVREVIAIYRLGDELDDGVEGAS